MDKTDIDDHLDAMLLLAMIDNKGPAWAPNPMSASEIAEATGIPRKEVQHIELSALKKLEKHPKMWEAVTQKFRNNTSSCYNTLNG